MDEVISLRGRELEPRVVGLLAAAQTRLPQLRRSARAPAIAYTYGVAPERDLWGVIRDRAILGVIGVEWRAGALWVRDIAVATEHRRTGLGRAMLAFVRASYGTPEFMAHVTSDAAPFFAACGFSIEDFGNFRSGAPRVRCTLAADRPLLGVPPAVEER